MESASADFALGREAALAGDAQCAEFYFSRALETVRPSTGEPLAGIEVAGFSLDLYEGVLRYEALAAPPEDSVAAENHVSPDLEKIETTIETTPEAISEAASAIASDTAGVTYDLSGRTSVTPGSVCKTASIAPSSIRWPRTFTR